MRPLLGLMCLVLGSPAHAGRSADGPSRMEQVQAVLVEIASEAGTDRPTLDLPDGLREALDAWTAERDRA